MYTNSAGKSYSFQQYLEVQQTVIFDCKSSLRDQHVYLAQSTRGYAIYQAKVMF